MIQTLTQPIVFCDVETTGGSAKLSRVTEIAAIRYENGVEVSRIDTLVNPHQRIPYNIQMITGINNQMTDSAPDFSDIAQDVADIFSGAILIAHHSRFDYSFIKAEMERAGASFSPTQMCTAKLSRKLYANCRGHGLSNIIERFGFHCTARHRAMGDTEILVKFAQQLEKDFTAEDLIGAIDGTRSTYATPPNIADDVVTSLPQTPGVYSFIGKDDEILYIGKSVNIRSRVMSHFSNSNQSLKAKRIWQDTHHIEYTPTLSDFSAQLLEIYKIKTEIPVYNRRLRRNQRLWALKRTTDSPYISFTIEPINDSSLKELSSIYAIFKTKSQAKKSLEKLVKEHRLCPLLMGLEKGRGACFSHQLGHCSGACVGNISMAHYNLAVEKVFAGKRLKEWPYKAEKVILTSSADSEKAERFVIDNWILKSAEQFQEQDWSPFFGDSDTFFDYDIYKVLAKYI